MTLRHSTPRRTPGPVFLLLVLLLALVLVSERRTRAIEVVSPLAEPIAQTAATAPDEAAESGIRRTRFVAVNTATLPVPESLTSGGDPLTTRRQPVLTLELFPDVFVAAAFDRFDPSAPNTTATTWVGHVEGELNSSVTLVYSRDLLTATINMARGTFTIRPVDANVRATLPDPTAAAHVIAEVDQNALPPEAEPVVPVLAAGAGAGSTGAAPTAAGDTDGVIDVLVLYTPLARSRVGGEAAMQQLIALAASETNTSYINSNITQRLRVVHTAAVDYTEVNDFSTNLSRLREGAPGLEGVAALRDLYGADLVSLLIHPAAPSHCGIAYIMAFVSPLFESAGVSVTDTQCVSPNLTFAHELGHNMGARHDWYVSDETTPFTYAHGFSNTSAGFRLRTIMAYPDHCNAVGVSCRRLVGWSNADQFTNPYCEPGSGFTCNHRLWYLPGARLGVPGGTRANCVEGSLTTTGCDADNRRTLNNTAATVSNFRQSIQ